MGARARGVATRRIYPRVLAPGSPLPIPRLTAFRDTRLQEALGRRTEPAPPAPDEPPYDLLRASANLVVASLLISLGTARGLPMSTTYITFMAAMGAALGDRVWGANCGYGGWR